MYRLPSRFAIHPGFFIGCLLSLITLVAAIAFVRAATLHSRGSIPVANNPATQKLGLYLSEPAVALVTPSLSGTKSICPSACDYLTITAAIADIQSQGLGGALTLELGPNYTSSGETVPLTFTNLTGASAVNTVTVRPQLGATNLIITGDNATSIIDLNNADYVTIDGRLGGAGTAKELTIENSNTTAATIRFFGGADNNTIKYVSLKGATNSAASGVVTWGGGGTNNNNTVDNCDIQGSGVATPSNGVYAGGGVLHSGNTISNCNIFDFHTASGDASGVRIDSGSGTGWAITGNSFYQTAGRVGTTGRVRAIYLNTGLGGSNFTVTNNFIGGTMPNAGGSAWTIIAPANVYRFIGIQLNVGNAVPSGVQANVVQNFSWLSSAAGSDPSDSLWSGILVASGAVNIGTATGNTIGSATGTGSIFVTRTSSGSAGFSSGIVAVNSNVTISNNTIASMTTAGTTNTIAASLVGIQVGSGSYTISNNTVGSASTPNSINAGNSFNAGGSGQEVTGIGSSSSTGVPITGNTVANLNNNSEAAGTTTFVRGIFTSSGTNTITNNTVRNLSTTSQNTNTNISQSVFGIAQTSVAASQTISQNAVHSLSNTAASAAAWVTGIYCAGQSGPTNFIERNLVHSLSLASTSGASTTIGIHLASGAFRVQNNVVRLGLDASGASTAGPSVVRGIFDSSSSTDGRDFYHNSIYLGGTQTAGNTTTFAFQSLGFGNLRTFRNNIFVNVRSNTGGATGQHYAVGYNGTGFMPAGLSSNHNIFFVNGTGGVMGSYNAVAQTTLAAWQNANGQDGSSAFVDPLFLNPAAGTPDLHLQATNPAEGSGIAVALVTNDFDGQTRSILTPTDVGADAGLFSLSSDAFPPDINYQILSSGSTTNRTLTGFATITDNVGVSDNPNRPRLYFKKSTDADAFAGNTNADNGWKFVVASNSTSPYDFTIDYSILNGGGVVVGDTIQYFLVAQDAANNLSSNPAGAGSSSTPPIQNVNVKPGGVSSYNIVGSIEGTKTVCAAGPPTCDYVNLTGANGIFADINSKVLNGNLTINIAGNLIEDGANGVNQIASNNHPQPSLTIQPADGTLKTISGNVASAMIRFNGADRVSIDGRFDSAGRFLLFRNTFSSFPPPTIRLANDSSNNTIRNSIIEGASENGAVVTLESGAITGNDNNLITGNIIRDRSDAVATPAYLISSIGTSATIANTGNTISNNELFNFTATGIFISASSFGNESWTIQGNSIYQTASRTTFLRAIDFNSIGTNTITQNSIHDLNGSPVVGIRLGDAFDTTVSRNRIYSFPSNPGANARFGIEFSFGTVSGRSVTLVNNQIVLIPAFTNDQSIRGIVDSGGAGSTFNAFYNSVLVGGTGTGSISTWACQRAGTSGSTHNSRNNICFNNRTGGTGNHFAAGNESTSGSFSSDYNLFVGTGSTPANFMNVGASFSAPVSFATWKSTTGGDANSLAGNPGGSFTTGMFVNPAIGDLHIVAGGNPLVSNTGVPVIGVTADYDNETRDATTPDIGSDELNPSPPDTTAPSVLFIDDGDADNAVFVNTPMTYTVVFNEDIDAATLTAVDFDNAGTSAITIGAISETSALSGVFTLQVTPTSFGTLILRVRSDNVIADTAGNNLAIPVADDSTITVSNAADVQINSHTDSPDPVFDGDLITYTIGFINNGPTNAASATVTDSIPANTTFFSASTSSSGWTRTDAIVSGGTGNIVFSNPSAPVGVPASFTVVVKVNAGTSTGTFITNIATAATSTLDPVPSNNSFSAFTSVIQSLELIVNDAGDAPDNNVGNGICDTSAAPGEQCTLRAAIQESNNTTDFDTIGFAQALNGSTIILNTALDSINSNLAITGPGANLLTVQRSDVALTKFRIFTINSGKTVSISGLTVTKGSSADGTNAPSSPQPGAYGGGILNLGTLALTDMVITGNRTGNGGSATNPGITFGAQGGYGGGISSTGSLAMTNVTVSNNLTGNGGNGGYGHHGGLGGGVHASGAMTMTTSSVTDNNTGIGGVGSENGGRRGPGGLGGGIYLVSDGTFTMTNITVTSNNTGDGGGVAGSGGHGGGIAYGGFVVPTGSASLINSTVSNNTTGDATTGQAGFGGGIFSAGTFTIIGSAITGNSTGFSGPGGGGVGGGIDNSGTLTMTNTTVSGNSTGAVGGTGGGLWNAGIATLRNCTIAFNTASWGGAGIHQYNDSSVISIGNSIAAGNSLPGSPTGPDVSGGPLYNSLGYNLIGNADGSTGFSALGDQVGTLASPLNARLGPLANNGGPTQTHALLAGSPALDAGNNSFITDPPFTGPIFNDQRGTGFLRIRDSADANTTPTVDIGAFEADPSVEDISNKLTSEDVALLFAFNVGDAATPFTSITATSNNQALVPNASIVIGPDTVSTRMLSITPAANQFGMATITVTVTKGTQSMSDTFILTVNGVNDPPSFTNGPDLTVVEDSGPQSLPDWATGVSPGPADELGQTVAFLIQNNTNPGLFSVAPAISPTGTLTYTSAASANGTATITIALMDNGGGTDTSASQQFMITVTAVNDAPTAVGETISNVAEDSGQRVIPFATLTANDSTGPANESGQTLIVKTVSNPVGGTVSISGGNVLFTPTTNYNGPASFDYTVEDNGTTNGAADPKSGATVTANFTITEVNDAPTAINDTLSNVAEDSGQRTIPFSTLTTNDSKGPANESGQTLIVKTVSNPVGGTVSIVAGNVIFTPAADYTGPASFDYTTEDNGTTNGAAAPLSSVAATASFVITEVNDAPVTVDDVLSSSAEDSAPRAIPFADLTGNDSKGAANESGQTLTVISANNAVGGSVLLVSGFVVFTLTGDYNGPASFSYTVQDDGTTNGVGDPKTSETAIVSFNVTEVNDAPTAVNDTLANVAEDSGERTIAFADLTGNDSKGPADESGQTLIVQTVSNPIGVTVSIVAGTVRVTPLPNFNGPASFQYTVRDNGTTNGFGNEKVSGPATVSFNITAPAGGVLRFSAANYSVAEGAGFRTITVERTGDSSQAVTVDYSSSDHSNPADFILCGSPGAGFASSRCDFTTAIGTLRFAGGETSKTFNVLISNDNYVEGPETLELTLSNPTGGAVFGVPQTAILSITDDLTEPATNPIDTSSEFVRSQYHDFLNREPDAPGLAFWTDNIEKCNDPARRPAGQTAAQCIDKQRESTAVAFFMAPEFQITGGYVYHLYKGSLTGSPNYDGGSAGRFPTSLEFLRDLATVSEGIVVNNAISGAVVEANRNRLAAEFVLRSEFIAKYGGLNNTLYVQELFNTTGIAATPAEKQALVDGLTGGTETKASVLRKVVDGTVVISESNVQFTTTYGQAFINQENSRVFVFMEYVGYLRRNPDQAGYVFWLGKLNTYGGDPFQAEMVRSFILAPEYRQRFGQ
jgi:hypothetical protein